MSDDDYFVRADPAVLRLYRSDKAKRHVDEMRLWLITRWPFIIFGMLALGYWLTWEHQPGGAALFLIACLSTGHMVVAWQKHGHLWLAAKARKRHDRMMREMAQGTRAMRRFADTLRRLG